MSKILFSKNDIQQKFYIQLAQIRYRKIYIYQYLDKGKFTISIFRKRKKLHVAKIRFIKITCKKQALKKNYFNKNKYKKVIMAKIVNETFTYSKNKK